MNQQTLTKTVQDIVRQAAALKDKHTTEKSAPVNYACIFSQSRDEYDDLNQACRKIGKVVQETKMGPVFLIKPMETISGALRLLKIRAPDATRPERGDADFTVPNYEEFKKKHLSKPGFKLIQREKMEMIELMDSSFSVRAYFSHPTLGEVLGIL